MRKLLLNGIIIGLLFNACGGGGSSDDSKNIDYTLGNNLMKLHTIANKVNYINLNRTFFSLKDYDDVNDYVDTLNKDVVCKEGNVVFEVKEKINKCGVIRITYNKCKISGHYGDGIIEINTTNYLNLDDSCIIVNKNTVSDYTYTDNLFNKDTNFTIKAGFTKQYSNDNDIYKYSIMASGDVIVNNVDYKLNNYKLSIENDSFLYSGGEISNNNYKINFTSFGQYIDTYKDYIYSSGYSIFLYNKEYYSVIAKEDGKVYLCNEQDENISNIYNFNDVYEIE